MMNVKNKKAVYALALIMALTACGCSSKKAKEKAIETTINTTDEDLQNMTSAYPEYVNEATTIVSNYESQQETNQQETIIQETEALTPEDSVINELNNEAENTKLAYVKEKYEDAKQSGKQFTIKVVDFLFYGTQINGITFNEMTTAGKQKVYALLIKVDSMIMTIDPNYKGQLGEKYNIVKDFSKEKLETAKGYIEQKIGTEKYESIASKASEKKSEAVSYYDNAKEKVKGFAAEKYQNYKNGN